VILAKTVLKPVLFPNNWNIKNKKPNAAGWNFYDVQ
jgi:hypothetical protein